MSMGFESLELNGPPYEELETRTLQLAPAVYGQQAAAENVTIPKREKLTQERQKLINKVGRMRMGSTVESGT